MASLPFFLGLFCFGIPGSSSQENGTLPESFGGVLLGPSEENSSLKEIDEPQDESHESCDGEDEEKDRVRRVEAGQKIGVEKEGSVSGETVWEWPLLEAIIGFCGRRS